MGCKKVMIKLGKAVLHELTPPGLKLLKTITGIVATTDWSNEQKRERAVEMASGALKDAGIEARESVIRSTQETLVAGMKIVGDELAVVGELEIVEAESGSLVTVEV